MAATTAVRGHARAETRCSSARSSSLGAQSPAATFCSTCSTLVAPAITDPTVGMAASPPIATWSSDTPRSPANSSIASMREKSACSNGSVCLASRVPAGAASPRRYLPVSRPRASGKYGSSDWPVCAKAGTSSASMDRLSQEYSFCAETKPVNPLVRATQSASTTCQPARLDEPR